MNEYDGLEYLTILGEKFQENATNLQYLLNPNNFMKWLDNFSIKHPYFFIEDNNYLMNFEEKDTKNLKLIKSLFIILYILAQNNKIDIYHKNDVVFYGVNYQNISYLIGFYLYNPNVFFYKKTEYNEKYLDFKNIIDNKEIINPMYLTLNGRF